MLLVMELPQACWELKRGSMDVKGNGKSFGLFWDLEGE